MSPSRNPRARFDKSSGPVAEASASAVAERSGVAPSLLWNLEHVFDGREAWEREFARVEGLIAPFAGRAGTLRDSAASLAEALRAHSELSEAHDKVFVYAHLHRDEDTRRSEPQGMAERAARLGTRIAEATAFLEPEILEIPRAELEALREFAELRPWRHYLDHLLRLKEHTLTLPEEKILAMAGEVTRVPRTAFGMLNDADLTFAPIRDEDDREVELTKGRYSTFMESQDRRVRRDAWSSLMTAYESHRNTLAALLAGSVKRDVFLSRVRGYDSCLHAALFPSNIPVPVFHTLLETVDRRREALHRYNAFRKRMLGVSELQVYDLYVPLSSAPPPRYSYDEASSLLRRGLTPLGADYAGVLEEGLSGGWIDVPETRGKRSGAYCWGSYGTHPYVLMNYQGTLDHVFTLAHEMGHALHHHFTTVMQPYVYSHYPIFLAEVASTTNEALLMDHMLSTTDEPDHRLALLNQYVEQIRGTVIQQVVFAEFEHGVHRLAEEGKPITAETLSDAYRSVFTRIMGPDLVLDDRAALGWARIPHFYTGYYVYQYATGYAAAIALSRRILAGGDAEREDYLGFLKAGDSDYPIEILRRAGVDLTTSGPVDDTLDLFESLLDELEQHVSRYGAGAAGGKEAS